MLIGTLAYIGNFFIRWFCSRSGEIVELILESYENRTDFKDCDIFAPRPYCAELLGPTRKDGFATPADLPTWIC